jgi:hypothetical protein
VNANSSVPWTWRADPSPPEPCGAVGWHDAARRLHARLSQLPPSLQARLFVSVSRDVLVVAGAAEELPWVPGIAYATRSADAPTLWRPTVLQPDVPADLLARSLRRFHARGPLLLWPEPAAVIPLDRQYRVSAGLLGLIAKRWQPA